MVIGGDGRLYGTTTGAGLDQGPGTLFSLSKSGGGFVTLHVFNSMEYQCPSSELTWGRDGRLYGTTDVAGVSFPDWPVNDGTVFAIAPNGRGFVTLRSFIGTDGNLYGTTSNGGIVPQADAAAGTVFEIELHGLRHDHR